MTANQVHVPSELQRKAARKGWTLTTTRTGSFMLRKGSYSRHFGELIDVARDVARMAVPRRRNNG